MDFLSHGLNEARIAFSGLPFSSKIGSSEGRFSS